MAIDRDISNPGIEVRRIDQAHETPFRHVRRDFCPMRAIIRRHVHKAVIRSGPEHSFFQRRFGERENRVVIFDARDVVRDRAAARLLFALVVTRQIGTDLRPCFSLVGRFENSFAACVNRVGIVRRKKQGRDPLKAVHQIFRAVPRIIERPNTELL